MANNPITQRQLDALEVGIDRLFANLGIDIEFTRHFLDRVNDSRNQTQITIRELGVLFVKEYKRWGPRISGMKYDDEAVMTDLSSDINIPVVVNKDGDEKDLVAKTVMRKKKFRTPDPQLTVEDDDPCWDSHKQLGMKKKGGKRVPNCVPKESARHPQTPLTEQQQFMLQRGAWECAQLREAKMDPREAILTQAIQYLDKLAMSKTDKQDISGYAFDIVRSFNIKDIISARELAALYHEWKGTVRHGGVW